MHRRNTKKGINIHSTDVIGWKTYHKNEIRKYSKSTQSSLFDHRCNATVSKMVRPLTAPHVPAAASSAARRHLLHGFHQHRASSRRRVATGGGGGAAPGGRGPGRPRCRPGYLSSRQQLASLQSLSISPLKQTS
jgi:hypothetical protein